MHTTRDYYHIRNHSEHNDQYDHQNTFFITILPSKGRTVISVTRHKQMGTSTRAKIMHLGKVKCTIRVFFFLQEGQPLNISFHKISRFTIIICNFGDFEKGALNRFPSHNLNSFFFSTHLQYN